MSWPAILWWQPLVYHTSFMKNLKVLCALNLCDLWPLHRFDSWTKSVLHLYFIVITFSLFTTFLLSYIITCMCFLVTQTVWVRDIWLTCPKVYMHTFLFDTRHIFIWSDQLPTTRLLNNKVIVAVCIWKLTDTYGLVLHIHLREELPLLIHLPLLIWAARSWLKDYSKN